MKTVKILTLIATLASLKTGIAFSQYPYRNPGPLPEGVFMATCGVACTANCNQGVPQWEKPLWPELAPAQVQKYIVAIVAGSERVYMN